MSKHKHTRTRTRKPIAIAVAAIVALSLMTGLAFAWSDFSQTRTNRFNGTIEPDATLHDEFDGLNKNIFVENSGSNPIYVRIRLDEFMRVGDLQFDPLADPRDPLTWLPHTYTGADINDCGQIGLNLFHDYYEWDMTGRQRSFWPGTPGMVYTTLNAEGKVDDSGAPYLTAPTAPPMKLSAWNALVESTTISMTAASFTPEQIAAEIASWPGCWLLDDTDTAANGGGWAYWSKPLMPAVKDSDGNILTPGQATNLLLDTVTLLQDPEDDWVYRINVKMQAVTATDFAKWDEAGSAIGYKLTDAAKDMIEILFGKTLTTPII
ncbi:MAG: hypothetical protein FWE80_07205 [Oscillospiraceae bacterium]|nr:hypothetical protein [Oscillospiraceae bacterium]